MMRNHMFLLSTLVGMAVSSRRWCQRGDACWPTVDEVKALYNDLDPKAERVLKWDGEGTPRVSAVPYWSPDDQPLYGIGVDGLEPLYYDEDFDISKPCFQDPNVEEDRLLCFAAIRNNPQSGVPKGNPGIVVFALNADHVVRAVKFAKKHNLCIATFGTGHDFVDRHSCVDGMFIRTTLIKGIKFNPKDRRWKHGSVTVGSGTVFSELHEATAQRGLYCSSGWAITVGVAGWSLGGGHGPNANAAGLGVDNILEVELVDANGDVITVNEKQNSDLFWALRGGVGSTWGIVTKFTLRTHKNPEGGFTQLAFGYDGDFCEEGQAILKDRLQGLSDWALFVDDKWSGINMAAPTYTGDETQCGGTWSIISFSIFQGSAEDALEIAQKFQKKYPDAFPDVQASLTNYATFWDRVRDYALEPISVVPWSAASDTSVGGIPSVLISRKKYEDGSFMQQVFDSLMHCPGNEDKCNRVEMYQCVTGNRKAKQAGNVSISPLFRTALTHAVVGAGNDQEMIKEWYKLGDHSYPNESAMWMPDWRNRYWGENYRKLKAIKEKYDPDNIFWCRHCVGDNSDGNEPSDDCGYKGFAAKTKNKIYKTNGVTACECEQVCEENDCTVWSYHQSGRCQCYDGADKIRVSQKEGYIGSHDGSDPIECGYKGFAAKTKNKVYKTNGVTSCECEQVCEENDSTVWSYHESGRCQCYDGADRIRVSKKEGYVSSHRS